MVEDWVEKERQSRKDKAERETKRRERILKAKAEEQIGVNDAFVRGISRVFAEERKRADSDSVLPDVVPEVPPLPLADGVNGGYSYSPVSSPTDSPTAIMFSE